MRLLLALFSFYILFSSSIYADSLVDIKRLFLKKDQESQILVKYSQYKKKFTLRWTLYTNEGLVVFSSYNKRVFQHVLYLNTTNQSFKIYLKTKGSDLHETPYLLVKFQEFDLKEHKVRFKIFLSDAKDQIKLEYPKK